MSSKIVRAAIVTLLLSVPAGASAQLVIQETQQTRSEQLQRAQEQQIRQAAASGRMDPRLSAQLLQRLERIQRAQERFYSDGVLTLREQARLERWHQRLQRHIDAAIAR